MSIVYLLHFDRAYRHARHYTGVAADLDARLAAHRGARSARLIEVITAAGIGFKVARLWPGEGRDKERRLKRSGGASATAPCARQEVPRDRQAHP